ncbi:alpha-amylase family glycosyl hydrolase [Dermabacter vaginalis]|uniref:alpha-amylase family glycosyl hydrolase n=1 Tax=Dermabacter vaginalis TaxID=1630135 RepID=UPI0021A686FC|nr:alpha-amylase family glycosyl hydrolase [Dermabacter vaginalis]MCT2150224.1 alpha-amylase family glycosyl hydrolase [Dermabacter vaginalis]
MAWIDHALWWHVYPLGFTDAPIREGDSRTGRGFDHLTSWLDYVQELGLNGIALGPIFASKTHGYDTLDYLSIDPRLGDDAAFDRFLAACKKRGIRVLLDGVFSHVSTDFVPLRRELENPAADASGREFDIDMDAEGGPAPRVWEGHGELARFHHESAAAHERIAHVMRFWLERGIDGWRLDAAYSVPPSFWSDIIPGLRRDFPEAFFFAEIIHGDYAAFVKNAGVDSATEYELWKAIYSSIEQKNLFELEWTLGRHNTFLEHFLPLTFVGNHDTSRIASVLGANGALTAHAILYTLGGTPALYYGDEQAFRGLKEERVGGDDDVRQAFPDSPSDFFGEGPAMREAIAGLIAVRRDAPWLVTARTEVLDIANEKMTYRAHENGGERFLDVEITLENSPHVTIREAGGDVLWSQPQL